MPWGLEMDPCVALAMNARETLLIWAAVLALAILVGPLLLRLARRQRRTVVAVAMVLVALFAPTSAYAMPPNYPGTTCEWLLSIGTPCWMLQALWCPCSPMPGD